MATFHRKDVKPLRPIADFNAFCCICSSAGQARSLNRASPSVRSRSAQYRHVAPGLRLRPTGSASPAACGDHDEWPERVAERASTSSLLLR